MIFVYLTRLIVIFVEIALITNVPYLFWTLIKTLTYWDGVLSLSN